jgi:hypothetical protein
MGRSRLEVLSILIFHQHLLHTRQSLPLPLPGYPPAQVLQIAERFYQTPLPPIIAREITKQLGPFAPWELPQFIATANPSATLSPSFLFPVQPVIGRTCSRVFLSGTRRASPVA